MTRTLARGAFLLSGVAGLTFEIVWMRHLGRAVGGTTIAVAATTAAYMGGLALGAHLGGRFADKLRRPLAVYGGLEVILALVGLVIPLLCSQVGIIDEALFAEAGTASVTRQLVRFFVAGIVLVVPTTAMGMTLPVLARAVADRVANVGREVGLLYALNIAGAMVGAALAGFVWIPKVGLANTNLIAVGIDLALGLAAVGAGMLLPAIAAARKEDEQQPILRPGSRPLVLLLVVTGVSAMALQVLWTRALGTALGPSTYAFTTIVCAYLGGLALGAALASWLVRRFDAMRVLLSIVLVGTGIAALFGILIVDDLPLLLQSVVLDPDLTPTDVHRVNFGLAALSVLPATIGMGAIFPVTLAAVVGSDARLGAAVGRTYALNTVGNIAGSFAAPFILLPLFGVEWGMRITALFYIVLAIYLLLRLEQSTSRLKRGGLAVACAVAFIAIALWPSWNVSKWTAGMFRMSMTRYFYPDGSFDAAELVFHEDGLSTTVTIEADHGVRWIKVNGKIDGSSEGDMPTQVLSGILPMVFEPNADNIAVIGCGSGVTVGAALQSNPQSLTLIELEPAVVAGAKLFGDVNHAFWEDARVTIIANDGRNFMASTNARYDVIISEPSNPWMTGASSLFTQEFFTIAAERLETEGVFLQWLQIYELAPERIASVLKTFHSVFPEMLVFTPHADSNDLLIMGKRTPWTIDWQALRTQFAALAPELRRAELTRLEDLLALLLFTDEQVKAFPDEIPFNTDDNAFVEFGAPLDLVTFAEDDPTVSPIEATDGKRPELVRRLSKGGEPWAQRFAVMSESYFRQGLIIDSLAAVDAVNAEPDAPAEVVAEANSVADIVALLEEDDRELVIDGATAKADPKYRLLAQLVQNGEEKVALYQMDEVPELQDKTGAHTLLYGFLLYRKGEQAASRRALLRARKDESMAAHRPAIAYYLAKGAFEAGHYEWALTEMARYRENGSKSLSHSASPD